MTYTAYIQRQKSLIRSRHTGEEYLICGVQVVPVKSSDRVMEELASLKGLNTNERLKSQLIG